MSTSIIDKRHLHQLQSLPRSILRAILRWVVAVLDKEVEDRKLWRSNHPQITTARLTFKRVNSQSKPSSNPQSKYLKKRRQPGGKSCVTLLKSRVNSTKPKRVSSNSQQTCQPRKHPNNSKLHNRWLALQLACLPLETLAQSCNNRQIRSRKHKASVPLSHSRSPQATIAKAKTRWMENRHHSLTTSSSASPTYLSSPNHRQFKKSCKILREHWKVPH